MLDRERFAPAVGPARGGYVLADADGDGDPELILIATGSEVALAVSAFDELVADGVRARVVSLPSWSLFDLQDDEYRDSRPPPLRHRPRLGRGRRRRSAGTATSAAAGRSIGMHTFGASAPLKDVSSEVRLHARAVVETAGGYWRRPERRRLMNATKQLHDLGQSLWLDNITRTMLDDGTLAALHRRARRSPG